LKVYGLKDENKTKKQLVSELAELRQRLAELQASEAPKESEARYKQLVESVNDIIYKTDVKGRFTYVNPVAERVIKYSKEKIIGRHYLDFVRPDFREVLDSLYKKQFKERRGVTYVEFPAVDGEGDEVWLGQNVQLITEGKKVVGFLAVARDITKQKRAEEELKEYREHLEDLVKERAKELVKTNEELRREIAERERVAEALRESEERFEQVVENAQEWIWEVDADGLYTYASPVVKKILGYEPKELVGKKHFYDLFYPEEREELRKTAFAAFARKRPFREFLNRNVHKDGSIVWLSTSGVPILGEEGELLGYRGADADITKRKRAEEELQKVNRTLKMLSECNQAVVRATDEVELLRQVCQIIVEVGGYHLAWIGFAEQDREKTVRPVAQAGYEKGYLKKVKVSWSDTELGHGPTGVAIRTGKLSIAKNITSDPKYAPWREEALKRGYASSIALPLIAEGRAFGALNIYSVEPDAFDEEEVSLLMELVSDLAFGVEMLRTRAERRRAEEELQQASERLRKAMDGTVQAIALMSEVRDPYTAGHNRRVAQLAKAMAEEMGFSEWQVEGMYVAGLLHDIGKIYIPVEILNKPGPLSTVEFDLIKNHSRVGYEILKAIDFPWPIALIALQHHERLDGSGYPDGIMGDEILLEAKVLAVADVVEVMISHRPYRPALSADEALKELSQKRGILYDPDAVDAFLRLFIEKGFRFE